VEITNDFTNLHPLPGVLREERTRLRKLLSSALKSDEQNASILAFRLYNLGLLVAALYGNHDCNSGVRGYIYDEAAAKMNQIAIVFSLNKGYIESKRKIRAF
jgi:hypothetical protein